MVDGNRVASLIDGLTYTFEAGLASYAKWKQSQEHDNNYQRSPEKKSPAVSNCSLITSLDISSHRIKATYQVGFALIGPEFAVGDTICRDCLWRNLSQLGDCVNLLQQRVVSNRRGPLNLYDIIHVSEATRHRCVAALAGQYGRLASGRVVPQELPIPSPRSSLRPIEEARHRSQSSAKDHQPAPPPHDHDQDRRNVEFDRQTAVWSTSSGPPVFQSEPPSPPLTPRLRPDDSISLRGGSSASQLGASSESGTLLNVTSTTSRRPNNSVFSIFCPEAMTMQVDPSRAVPTAPGRPTCRCGYRWDANFSLGEDGAAVLLKDGFRMTRRFLAKSHCDRATGDGGAGGGRGYGYGCVLCTSSGRTEMYESAETLRVHVNAAHTKWQMLHDSDMT